MATAIRNLIERRVPQVLAIYLGAAFGVVQFVDFVGSRYLLPPVWTDLSLLAMALLLPSVMLYTYNHGRPGPDEWRKSEKVFIPVNLAVLFALVTFVGAGAPLSPTSKRITVTDEKGNTREAVVANKAYRKRVAFFMFDTPADSSVQWLQLGLPLMTMEDLSQSNFIEVVPSIYMRDGLEKVGFAKGVNVPLSAKRTVVSELHVPHFVAGKLEKSGNEYVAKVQIYETESGKLVREREYRGPEPTQLGDQIAEGVLKDLEIPELTDDKVNMPVADILSTNPQALHAYIEAYNAIFNDRNWPLASKLTARAVELDPTFAAAHFLNFQLARVASQPQLAQTSAKKALDLSYRLPERTRELVKANYYIAKEDWPHAYAVLEMLAKMYPEDIQVQLALVQINAIRDNRDALVSSLKKVLELDPSRSELLLTLGDVYEQKGESKQALQYIERYTAKYPTDVRGPRQIASLYRRLGDHARAKAAYDDALVINPEDVQSLVGLARLNAVTGDFAAAEKNLTEALEAARTPEERRQTHAMAGFVNEFRGDIRAAVASGDVMLKELAAAEPPLVVLQYSMGLVNRLARVDVPGAERRLNALRGQASGPPGSYYLPRAEVGFYVEAGDADKADVALKKLDAIIKQTSWNFMVVDAAFARGRIAELRGNCDAAIESYRQVAKLDASRPDI
ncbi:MAG TPA: tetratricopeptide repeat protein, partial [Longimicrobiales bacterium]